MLFKLGSLSNSTWNASETEASHANVSLVVDCFPSEIHPSRETGSPEQSHPEIRRPLAQSRPSAAFLQFTRQGRRKTSFSPFFASRTTGALTRSRLRTSLRSSIAVSSWLLPAMGSGAASATQDVSRAIASFVGAGRNNRPLTAAPRGGRRPSLASLVALGCWLVGRTLVLVLVRYSISVRMLYSSIGPKGKFFTKLYSNQLKFIFSIRFS